MTTAFGGPLWGGLGLPSAEAIGYGAFAGVGIGVFARWLAALAWLGSLLLGYAVIFGIFVSLARGCGIRLPRITRDPLRSRSLNEFFGRLMSHNSDLLIHLFVQPLWTRTRFVETITSCSGLNRRVRLFLVTSLSVSAGGLILHSVSRYSFLYRTSPQKAFEALSSSTPYFLALGLAAGISAARRPRGEAPPEGGLRQIARISTIFIGLYLLLVLVNGASTESFDSRLNYLIGLFGFLR
jgi:hypothetical protein